MMTFCWPLPSFPQRKRNCCTDSQAASLSGNPLHCVLLGGISCTLHMPGGRMRKLMAQGRHDLLPRLVEMTAQVDR